MKNISFLLVAVLFFSTGCGWVSGTYGIRFESHTERKERVYPPHRDDIYESATRETDTEYEYRQGFGSVKGGCERFHQESELEYDSEDDETEWDREHTGIEWEQGR